MRERIELHVETCYSWNKRDSVITVSLLDKLKDINASAVAIVDYCDCAGIMDFEKKRLETFKINKFKIVYGISLNIKYKEVDVSSIMLAKNKYGLKEIYKLVSIMNERKCFFVNFEDITNYKDVILGISDYDFEKDYSSVIDRYSYVEVNTYNDMSKVLMIKKFCSDNNLLMIASSCPKRIGESDDILNLVYSKYNNVNFDMCSFENCYWSTDKMLKHFNYLDNVEDVVINNSYKIVEQVSDYNFNYYKREMISYDNNFIFRKEVIDRLKLIYLDNISNDAMDRINYEFDVIEKNNLVGTFMLLEKISRKVREAGYYIDVGGHFSESFVAYVLGISRINSFDLKHQKDIFLNKDNIYIDIYVSEEMIGVVNEYIKEMLGKNKLFSCYRFLEMNKKFVLSQQKKLGFNNDVNGRFNDLKVDRLRVPFTYFIIPKAIDVLEYCPVLDMESDKNALGFDYRYLKNIFCLIRYKTPFMVKRFKLLEEKSGVMIDDISLDYDEVFENLFEVVEENSILSYDNYVHYNMMNNYHYTLKLYLNKKNCPNNIYELLEFGRDEYYGWSSKVLRYYYDNYYRTFYPNIYYEIYLKQLIDYFDVKSDNLYDDKSVNKFIIMVISDMKKMGFEEIVERVMNGEEDL